MEKNTLFYQTHQKWGDIESLSEYTVVSASGYQEILSNMIVIEDLTACQTPHIQLFIVKADLISEFLYEREYLRVRGRNKEM